MKPLGANLGHPDDLVDEQELTNQVIYVKKALAATTYEDRDEALLEGLMRFGLRFLPTLGQLARMQNKQGALQDLAERMKEILLDWLDGKRMTERADEDECRAILAITVLEVPAYKALWNRACGAIMALPEGHARRDIPLVQRSLLVCLSEAQTNKDVDEEATVIGDLLGYQLLPIERSLQLLDHGLQLLDKISSPTTRHNLLVQTIGYCIHFAFKARDSGETEGQQVWASGAEAFLKRLLAYEPDLLDTANGMGLYATVMELNGRPEEAVRVFAEAVDKSSPQESSYQQDAVIEKRYRMASGEYERVVKILTPLVDVLEEKYLAAVADHTIKSEGEEFSEVSWSLAFAHAHLGQWAQAVPALERGKSLRLRYQAALRRSAAGQRLLELESYLYALQRGVPLELSEFTSDLKADRLGADTPLHTKVLEAYRQQRLKIPQTLPPPPTIREMAATLRSDEAVVSLGVMNGGGTLMAVICPGDVELPSGRFLLGDWPLHRWSSLFAGEKQDGWLFVLGVPEAGIDRRTALSNLLGGVDEVLGQQLAELLRSKGTRRVTIIPHSWLHMVPFWALPSLAGFEVLMSASASHFTQAGGAQQVEQPRALVVADPTCDLPASLAEADSVTRHLAQLGCTVERLQRRDATEERIVKNLPGASIFHFCGHGRANLHHPTRAALFVSPDLSRFPAAAEENRQTIADPFQTLLAVAQRWQAVDSYERCTDLPGLGRLYEEQFPENKTLERRLEYDERGTLWRRYLNGEPASPLAELWTAGDILVQESLRHCRLAFLSACEAGGSGASTLTDEYSGLPAALQLAGVSTIISSFWPVSDALTAFYVDLFYAALVQSAPEVNIGALVKTVNERLRLMKKEEAISALEELRLQSSNARARITLEIFIGRIKEGEELPFQHPYDWAAFYVTGTGDITFPKGELA